MNREDPKEMEAKSLLTWAPSWLSEISPGNPLSTAPTPYGADPVLTADADHGPSRSRGSRCRPIESPPPLPGFADSVFRLSLYKPSTYDVLGPMLDLNDALRALTAAFDADGVAYALGGGCR
jgi:hypothetical protein